MRHGSTNREFYRDLVHATEGAQRQFVQTVESAVESYFVKNPQKQTNQGRMVKKWQTDLLLYGELENLSLLDVAGLERQKNTECE